MSQSEHLGHKRLIRERRKNVFRSNLGDGNWSDSIISATPFVVCAQRKVFRQSFS